MEAQMTSETQQTGPGPEQNLDGLQARLKVTREAQDRLHSLLEAVLAVGRDLDLAQVLRHVVESAVVLVEARQGTLAIVGEGGRLSQFVTVGLDQDSSHQVTTGPDSAPDELVTGQQSARSFVEVPVRVRGQVFGNLYLAEKRSGAAFDQEDESLLSTLAVAAGVAIDNARLYREARQRERWLSANAEVTNALLSGSPQAEVLHLVVDRAREIAEVDLAVIALPVEGTGELSVELAVGEGAQAHRALLLPEQGSFVGAALRSGGPVISPDVNNDPRITEGPPRWDGLGPAVAVRMGTVEGGVRGVLMLARTVGGPEFTPQESAPLLGFAGQAALALELADRRRDAEQIALLEDRDRIARDLHDLAIQRLFATGMTLQSAERFIEHPQAVERVRRAVDDLDATVKIIRTTIFGLRARDGGPSGGGLRARVVEAVQRAVPTLGFTPALRMEGLLDTDVPATIAEDVIAVLGEALSNAARHARARSVEVTLAATRADLALTVTDDGGGVPEGVRRSGLANLAERAQGYGGVLLVGPGANGGTRLLWRVPLAPAGQRSS
jgi:signal transduction histidine kinase